MTNHNDLSKLGSREIHQLGDLLKAYANNPNDCGLGDKVNWEYNPMSDNLFLVDENYNVAMMNGDDLEQFFSCLYCGHEGFKEEYGRERTEDGILYLACSVCEEEGRNPEDYLIAL